MEIIIGLAAIGMLVGVAYYLDRRRKSKGPIGLELPPLEQVGKIGLWVVRISAVLLLFTMLVFAVNQNVDLLWIGFLFIFTLTVGGMIMRVGRRLGK